MALTNGFHVFAGLHEDAVNKFLNAYRAVRPKYFFYACPPLGSGTPGVDFWIIPPLPIPGTGSGMPFSVKILKAAIDFTPANGSPPLPPPLTLGLEVCFLCGALQKVSVSGDGSRDNDVQRPGPSQRGGRPKIDCAKLSIWAVGHPLSIPNSHGGRDIGLQVDQIVIKDVGALEPLLECYSEAMLNSLLDALRYPVEQFALGTFLSLTLADGPHIADDQLKVWAKIS